MGLILTLNMSLGSILNQGGVAGPYPAPAGLQWFVVVESPNRIVENGNRAVELRKAA